MFRDWRLVLVVAAAVGLWVPLSHVEWFHSHEQSTYVVRTVEWAEELRAGHLYPRWAPDLYGGYGEPLFVFYAPAIYSLSGLLSATFLDPFVSLKLLLLFASLISGLGVYALIWGETREPDGALLGAIAYLAAPYRLGDLYARGDLGEFSCLALLPVVIALYIAAAREARPLRARLLAACAALVHCAMIITHTILGLWGSLVVGVVVLAQIAVLSRRGKWRRAVPLVLALGSAPGLAGVYVVPAIAYRGITHAAALTAGFYKPQNQWIGLNVLFDGHSDLFGRNFLCIGPLIVAAALVTASAMALNFKRARPALGWLALCLALTALTLPDALPFWKPGRVPLAQFIQFPWRLLGPAALTASVALGVAASAAATRLSERLKSSLSIACGAACLLFMAWPYASAEAMSKAGIATTPEVIRLGVDSTTAADEFLPLAIGERPSAPRAELIAAKSNARLDFAASDGSRHTLAIVATRPGAIVQLALYAFPGWRIKTDSGPVSATLDDFQGFLRIHLPASGKYQIEVSYGMPPAARLGVLVSVLAALALCLMLLRGSRWWPLRLPRMDGGASAI